VLFASGYAESIEAPEGMHVIGKPFSIDQLRDKVKSILGDPASRGVIPPLFYLPAPARFKEPPYMSQPRATSVLVVVTSGPSPAPPQPVAT
jgi:hypothetical protein